MMVIFIIMGVCMGMLVIMTMRSTMPIRPAFRCERSLQLFDICPQQAQHVFKHMVLLNQKIILFNLTGGMPVSDMPGDTRQMVVRNFQQRFWFWLDSNDAPIL